MPKKPLQWEPQRFSPEHELMPQVRVELAAVHVTPPEQQLAPHVTAHEPLALQRMGPEQDELPQLTVQLAPPQVMPPEHELVPHSMSQLPALLQSTGPLHPLSPHRTRHATPAGQVTPPAQLPAHSITQRPLASQVPPGQAAAEHGLVAPLLGDAAPQPETTRSALKRTVRMSKNKQIAQPGARALAPRVARWHLRGVSVHSIAPRARPKASAADHSQTYGAQSQQKVKAT
jgi:hypothetical protein